MYSRNCTEDSLFIIAHKTFCSPFLAIMTLILLFWLPHKCKPLFFTIGLLTYINFSSDLVTINMISRDLNFPRIRGNPWILPFPRFRGRSPPWVRGRSWILPFPRFRGRSPPWVRGPAFFSAINHTRVVTPHLRNTRN